MVAAEQAGGLAPVPHTQSLLSPQYGRKKLKYLPYNHQHQYFFLSECGASSASPQTPRPG